MATSPNFGWLEPDNTDLVKNGALAIRTLGNAIDASMADLKGGTTGQVLAKQTNTDMDFVWTTPSGGSNQFFAGKNKIINGDFRINQRAFTTSTTSAYHFDRWSGGYSGGTVTYSAQTFTLGTAPVSGYEGTNFYRIAVSGQSAAGDYAIQRQYIESVRTFANQTVTVSLWAKANASGNFAVDMYQDFGTGGSPSGAVNITGQKTAVTTSWARYSFTFSVPSISGKTLGTNNNDNLALRIWSSAGSTYNTNTNTLGTQAITLDIWGVQIEAGSTATDFQTATGTIQGELAACQRYYTRAVSGASYGRLSVSTPAASTGTIYVSTPLPVRMRVAPTSLDYSTLAVYDGVSVIAVSSLALDAGTNTDYASLNLSATGLTQFRPYFIVGNASSAAYLGFSAEL